MKRPLILTAALNLTITVSALVPSGESPRALGASTVHVARSDSKVNINRLDLSTSNAIEDSDPNTSITGPIGGQVNACTYCNYFISSCKEICHGNHMPRNKCADFGNCSALRRMDCLKKECKPKPGPECANHKSRSLDSRRLARSLLRRGAAQAIDWEPVDESSHYAVGKRISGVPIEHLDDPAVHKEPPIA